MARRPRNVTPPDDGDEIEGKALDVDDDEPTASPGNDEELIADLAAHRARALSPVPQRQLVLTNEDRMTVHGLITANLGAQGRNISPAEFEYFIRVCELRGVNPLFREAHLIKDGDGRITVQIGIDGFRKLSEDSGEYRGMTEAEWSEDLYEGPIAAWKGKPNYVRIGVLREGFAAPIYGEAWLDEDGQVDRDGKPIGQWGKRVRTMLVKVAEVRARRAAFPRSLAGLYSDDEIPEPRFVGSGSGTTAGALPEGPPQPTQATETGDPIPEGTWRPAEPPPAPEGLQGIVQDSVDGIHRTKPTSEISRRHGFDGTRMADKLEIVFKVGNKKHTAMIFDDFARAVDALQIRQAEVVVVSGGKVEEHIWQEGKPPQRQVWSAQAVYVLRDGAWVSAGDVAPSFELDATPPVDSSTDATAAPGAPASAAADPTPASAPAPTTSVAAPEAATPSPAPTAPAAPPVPTPAPTASPSSTSSTASAPSRSDLPPLDRAEDSIVTLPVRLVEPIEFREASGRVVGVLKAAYGDESVKMALGDDPPGEVEAQLGSALTPTYEPGDELVVVGAWKNGWIVVTGIGKNHGQA